MAPDWHTTLCRDPPQRNSTRQSTGTLPLQENPLSLPKPGRRARIEFLVGTAIYTPAAMRKGAEKRPNYLNKLLLNLEAGNGIEPMYTALQAAIPAFISDSYRG